MDLKKITPIVRCALKEDVGRGDVTTNFCIPRDRKAKALVVFKESGVVCGMEVTKLAFHLVARSIRFRASCKDGDRVRAGKVVARIEGPARSILTAERTALNFLSHFSGIATRSAEYVKRVRPYKVKIMDTRKTTPGLRYLEKYAVRLGGGVNHRIGLYDQVLIKDNHLRIRSSEFGVRREASRRAIQELIKQAKKKVKKKMKVEVEVKNLPEFKAALEAHPDIIMLDNMSLSEIRKAAKLKRALGRSTKLEVSGSVTLGNVRDIARAGVDMISIGELTHSVRSIDVALEIE